MPPSKKPTPVALRSSMLALMAPWPQSWAGAPRDIQFGEGIADAMRPFIEHLCTQHFAPKTIRRHVDACWVIGGEVIRRLYDEPGLRKRKPDAVLLETIADGEAPLVRGAAEDQQNRFDATARRLLRFLTDHPHPE